MFDKNVRGVIKLVLSSIDVLTISSITINALQPLSVTYLVIRTPGTVLGHQVITEFISRQVTSQLGTERVSLIVTIHPSLEGQIKRKSFEKNNTLAHGLKK